MLFNFRCGCEVLLGELHTNTGLAITLRTFWCNPNHLSRDGYFLSFVHESQENKYFVAEPVLLIRWDE